MWFPFHSRIQPNYQKMVDPPIPVSHVIIDVIMIIHNYLCPPQPYSTILGGEPASNLKGNCRGPTAPMQICLPTVSQQPHSAGMQGGCEKQTIIQVPKDPVRTCPKIVCDVCPPPPPTKVWLIKSSPVPQKVGISRLLLFLLVMSSLF